VVSHFRILERLGGGARGGVVYKALDLDLERLVALKILPASAAPRPEDRRRLIREAGAVAALEHPNLCPVSEISEIDQPAPGGLLLAMAFCEGESLRERLARGPLKLEVALDLAAQIAAGLARTHQRGIAHRGLKPSDILIAHDGQARIVDFGLAVLDEGTRGFDSDGAAAPEPFRSPEQLQGQEGGPRSDLWSLGALLYTMLAGRPPFPQGASAGAPRPEPLSALREGVPPELDAIVERALAFQPEARYASAEEMRRDLRALGRTGPDWQVAPSSAAHPRARIGPYRVGDLLGGGGMGVVYRAEDTRLGRTVALKLLPPGLARDPVSKARFHQEARAASALDHPNVCTIYDLGETEEQQLYLAMPCYDGETLRSRLARGPLPVPEALDIAAQVALGLAKAHRQGIVHRDVKPANLMLTADGVVKILDFGIAKLIGEAGLTRAGTSVGTLSYMAPEQARGETVDGRADLWSLGVVLYEMLAGVRPFRGEEAVIRQALLQDEPEPLARLRPEVPAEVDRMVRKLLAKDPEGRYATAEAFLEELRPLVGSMSYTQAMTTEARVRPRRRWTWAGVAALLIALAGLGGYFLRRGEEPPQPLHATFTRLTDQEGSEIYPSLSPDGSFFVYARTVNGSSDLFLQRVGGGNPIDLTPGTPWDDTQPAFSPDGQQIAFRSERDGGGIFVMGATGESVRRVTGFGYNPSWSPDGKEIAVATEGVSDPGIRVGISQLWRVEAATGRRRLATRGDAVQPSWSPDGSRIAYWGLISGSQRALWTIPVAGGEPRVVTGGPFLNWNPIWAPDGRSLYFISDRGGSMNLWRIAIDPKTGQKTGEPEPVTTPASSCRYVSVSRDGRRILYATDDSRANIERYAFDPARREISGGPSPLTFGTKAVRSIDVSPDGRWITFDIVSPQEDLFLVRSDGAGLRQLTNDVYRDRVPRWSPDGRRILFYSNRGGQYQAWTLLPDGSDLRPETPASGESFMSPRWSPDGRRLAGFTDAAGTVLVDLTRPLARRQPRPLARTGADAATKLGIFSWSPDGRWLAVAANSPQGEMLHGLFVYSLATGGLEKLTERGVGARWLGDSRSLVTRDGDALLWIDLATRRARKILEAPSNSTFQDFALDRAGRALYAVRRVEEGDVWMLTWNRGDAGPNGL
jgi:serine/threonine protein kinase/Tol biopolymer transport system component